MIGGYLASTCKVGQGAACCRYVTMGPEGWECGKMDPAIKRAIDARAALMGAKSDNCDGVTDLNARSKDATTNFKGVDFIEVPGEQG
jgi:hypothetical protein